jgi:hypothetical protein
MSYKSREKKRQLQVSEGKCRAAIHRHRRSEKTRARHFLTPVSRNCCCNRCGTSLRDGRDDCVYRHTPREILCLNCANLERIPYRPSSKWERRHSKRNGQPIRPVDRAAFKP